MEALNRPAAPRVRRSIRARILAVFLASLVTFVGAQAYALVELRAIGDGLAVIDRVYLPLAEEAAQLQSVLRQLDRDVGREWAEGLRPVEGLRVSAGFASKSVDDGIARSRDVLGRAKGVVTEPVERGALAVVESNLDTLDARRQAHDEAFAAWQAAAEGTVEARAQAFAEMERTRKLLGNGVREISALVQGRIQKVSERTTLAQDRAFLVSGALGALSVVLAGVMAAVALWTLRPIERLTEQVQRLAAGEAAGRVDVRSQDEVAVLALEFNAMADAVAERDRTLSERARALDRLSADLRRVLDTIRAGLLVVEDGRVAMLNPAAATQWGVGVGDPLPDALAALADGRTDALEVGSRRFDFDVVGIGERGRLFVVEDVTERLQDRERLQRSERLALVGQMLAQVNHEVRNPLNAMSLNAELLAEELDGDEARAMLVTIQGEIKRLEQVTARYLDLSRRRRAEWVEEDPGAVVRTAALGEEEVYRRAGVDLAVDAPDQGVWQLDADALRRALRNMLRNALEAGAEAVSVQARLDGVAVLVVVQDDGKGMTGAELAHAFEPFFTTKAKGTGLGLAICRQEVEDVGGSLSCTSSPERGSVFTLRLPLQPSHHVGGA